MTQISYKFSNFFVTENEAIVINENTLGQCRASMVGEALLSVPIY